MYQSVQKVERVNFSSLSSLDVQKWRPGNSGNCYKEFIVQKVALETLWGVNTPNKTFEQKRNQKDNKKSLFRICGINNCKDKHNRLMHTHRNQQDGIDHEQIEERSSQLMPDQNVQSGETSARNSSLSIFLKFAEEVVSLAAVFWAVTKKRLRGRLLKKLTFLI